MTHSFAQDTAGGMVMCMIVGAVLLFHGARVYTGRKRVAFRETHTVRGDIRRPDIDLAAAWAGAGLVLIGAAGLSAIVPSGPVSIISLVLAVVGGAGVIAGIIFGFLYLPKRIRPAWLTGRQPAGARTPRGGRPGGPGRR